MLIVIVVAAAVALAAFVASYQKQLQSEEAQSQQRSLESLKILSISPVLDPTNSSLWDNFTFVLASEYVNPSIVDAISLNGQPLKVYWVSNLTSPIGPPIAYSGSVPFTLAPRQEVVVAVNLTAPGGDYTWYSVYDDSFLLTTTDYIELSVYTALQNTFTQVFVPPTAIAVVSSLTTLSGGVYVTAPILDGSNSFQPGNGTVVAWNWDVTNTTSLLNSSSPTISNPTVVASPPATSETGTVTFAEPIGFVTGIGIWLTTSCSGCTGGQITPGSLVITSQSVKGGVITVNYAFTYTATTGGVLSASGASLNYTSDQTIGFVAASMPTVVPSSVVIGANAETGSATFPEPAGFAAGTAVALSLTGSAIGSLTSGPTITSESVTMGVVTVNYAFTYAATAAGTLAASGATVTYTTGFIHTFSGEKAEPSYWANVPAEIGFTIVLTVVNSDDLFGVAQIIYINP